MSDENYKKWSYQRFIFVLFLNHIVSQIDLDTKILMYADNKKFGDKLNVLMTVWPFKEILTTFLTGNQEQDEMSSI